MRTSDQPEREIAGAIRAWIREASPAARDLLARYGVAHCRAFLTQRRALRRFGFLDEFSEVAGDVAGMEVAELLRPGPGSGGRRPIFLRRLAAALVGASTSVARFPARAASRKSRDGDLARVVLDADDRSLFLAYRKVLRLRADQGLRRHWAIEHPEQARLLRRVKAACRASTEVRLECDARGTFVVSEDSDLGKRALSGPEIRTCLDRFHREPRAVLTSLRPLLVADREHGGYCYLMDLVREIRADQARRFVAWHQQESGLSGGSGIRADGVPLHLLLERMRRSLYRLAEGILNHDRHDVAPGMDAVWCEVAVEMLLRRYGLSEDGHDPLLSSQRRLLESKLGMDMTPDTLRRHEVQTTYLVRRLRARWEG